MRFIKVTFDDGRSLKTSINGTDQEIRNYYMGPGQWFNLGKLDDPTEDSMHRAVAVEFLDKPRNADLFVGPTPQITT